MKEFSRTHFSGFFLEYKKIVPGFRVYIAVTP